MLAGLRSSSRIFLLSIGITFETDFTSKEEEIFVKLPIIILLVKNLFCADVDAGAEDTKSRKFLILFTCAILFFSNFSFSFIVIFLFHYVPFPNINNSPIFELQESDHNRCHGHT